MFCAGWKAVVCGAASLLAAGTVWAEADAGLVAAVQGKVQIQRRGTPVDARVGSLLRLGDRLRTAATERVKVVVAEDTVIDVGPSTELVIDETLAGSGGKRQQSAFRLFGGVVLARVGDAYRAAGSRFEVETSAATIRVQGTEFIVSHDVATEVTEVIGISGDVDVAGKIGAMGGGPVRIGPGMSTRVHRGRLPSSAERLAEARVRQVSQGIEILGTGRRDGLNVFHPVIAGRLITPADVPGGGDTGSATPSTVHLAAVTPGVPGSAVRSLDVYTNTQPLEVYQVFSPGRLPSGGIKVEF